MFTSFMEAVQTSDEDDLDEAVWSCGLKKLHEKSICSMCDMCNNEEYNKALPDGWSEYDDSGPERKKELLGEWDTEFGFKQYFAAQAAKEAEAWGCCMSCGHHITLEASGTTPTVASGPAANVCEPEAKPEHTAPAPCCARTSASRFTCPVRKYRAAVPQILETELTNPTGELMKEAFSTHIVPMTLEYLDLWARPRDERSGSIVQWYIGDAAIRSLVILMKRSLVIIEPCVSPEHVVGTFQIQCRYQYLKGLQLATPLTGAAACCQLGDLVVILTNAASMAAHYTPVNNNIFMPWQRMDIEGTDGWTTDARSWLRLSLPMKHGRTNGEFLHGKKDIFDLATKLFSAKSSEPSDLATAKSSTFDVNDAPTKLLLSCTRHLPSHLLLVGAGRRAGRRHDHSLSFERMDGPMTPTSLDSIFTKTKMKLDANYKTNDVLHVLGEELLALFGERLVEAGFNLGREYGLCKSAWGAGVGVKTFEVLHAKLKIYKQVMVEFFELNDMSTTTTGMTVAQYIDAQMESAVAVVALPAGGEAIAVKLEYLSKLCGELSEAAAEGLLDIFLKDNDSTATAARAANGRWKNLAVAGQGVKGVPKTNANAEGKTAPEPEQDSGHGAGTNAPGPRPVRDGLGTQPARGQVEDGAEDVPSAGTPVNLDEIDGTLLGRFGQVDVSLTQYDSEDFFLLPLLLIFVGKTGPDQSW